MQDSESKEDAPIGGHADARRMRHRLPGRSAAVHPETAIRQGIRDKQRTVGPNRCFPLATRSSCGLRPLDSSPPRSRARPARLARCRDRTDVPSQLSDGRHVRARLKRSGDHGRSNVVPVLRADAASSEVFLAAASSCRVLASATLSSAQICDECQEDCRDPLATALREVLEDGPRQRRCS